MKEKNKTYGQDYFNSSLYKPKEINKWQDKKESLKDLTDYLIFFQCFYLIRI